MAGIYIHVPFCKTKCHYCDFYKSTDFSFRQDYLKALKKEMILRKEEMKNDLVQSIYFGGGTPSVLKVPELEAIIDLIRSLFLLEENVEITMEGNPDDLDLPYLHDLQQSSVNRLSIGIQSFSDRDLQGMNRRHRSDQAIEVVHHARQYGFKNISIDLIYGLPNQCLDDWKKNVEQALLLNVEHISAYDLTYHEGTVFYEDLKKGKIQSVPEELSLEQFNWLCTSLKEAGYEHYEISNFCKSPFYSRHNRSYWERKKYLGFGPSAHSYDIKSRRWNVANLEAYIRGSEQNEIFWESEILSDQDQYNDYIITSLRTSRGISETTLASLFLPKYVGYFKEEIVPFIQSKHVLKEGENYRLTTEGLFISDLIMKELFFLEEV